MSEQEGPELGVLIVNLGTPDAPTASALRRYLAEFLWDRRVVDLSRPVWWLILHGIILRTRPARSARSYQAVWTERGAPLLDISLRQARAIDSELRRRFKLATKTVLGMRYGRPSIAQGLRELRDAGAQRIVVLPLYPQNSCSTTASTFDAIAEEFKGWRGIPHLRFVAGYHREPAYVSALAESIQDAWKEQEPGKKLIFSFHGTPERFHREGDPYALQCHETACSVAEALELGEERWTISFQSRFGREEWLRPYTDDTLRDLAQRGVDTVDVICPGFAADCLETLEEIAVENRNLFVEAGGKKFRYIPALNDRPDHIAALVDLIEGQTQGWIKE